MTGSPPTDLVLLDRAHSFANEAVFTVALQCRRLETVEPEDATFLFRWWADLQFLVIALCHLRSAAELAARVPRVSAAMQAAISAFDRAVPGVRLMRNVGEHITTYAVDDPRRHDKSVERRQLQVGSWAGGSYCWLGYELSVDAALTAAEDLYFAVEQASRPSS